MQKKYQTTTSHDDIKSWAAKYEATPALIIDPVKPDQPLGIRFDFPGIKDELLMSDTRVNEDADWSQFFKIFEDKGLAFEYLLEPGDILPIDSFRFVTREALSDKKVAISAEELAKASRDDLPEYVVHDGETEKEGEVIPVISDDVAGEAEISGDSPDPDSDYDITQKAKDLGLDEEDDPEA